MAVKIRLSRGGSKKRPYYHIVVADERAPRDGKYIEKVGSFNPMVAKDSAERVKLVSERIKHWLSVGAIPTDRVKRFLDAVGEFGIKRVVSEQTKKHLQSDRTIAKIKEKEEKLKAAAEAAAEAAAAESETSEEVAEENSEG